MRARPVLLAVVALALVCPTARAELAEFSHLGIPVRPAGAPAGGLLAQRTIDREWGPSDDSTYHEVEVPGWKSEGLAMVLSGVAPGAGHLYLGEGSGWAYALSEVALWLGHWYEVRQQRQAWVDTDRFLGNPFDTTAAFSFARYSALTHHDAADLERLWYGDRFAYYREIETNDLYSPGFRSATGSDLRAQLHDLVASHDDASRRQWLFDAGVWANHLLAGLDALRAARAHNAPLREEYHLELGERTRNGRRELRAALVRRF